MEIFDLKAYWRSLAKDDRQALAEDAGTTALYMQTHIVRRTKIPGKGLMHNIFNALKKRGVLNREELLLAFFYVK